MLGVTNTQDLKHHCLFLFLSFLLPVKILEWHVFKSTLQRRNLSAWSSPTKIWLLTEIFTWARYCWLQSLDHCKDLNSLVDCRSKDAGVVDLPSCAGTIRDNTLAPLQAPDGVDTTPAHAPSPLSPNIKNSSKHIQISTLSTSAYGARRLVSIAILNLPAKLANTPGLYDCPLMLHMSRK